MQPFCQCSRMFQALQNAGGRKRAATGRGTLCRSATANLAKPIRLRPMFPDSFAWHSVCVVLSNLMLKRLGAFACGVLLLAGAALIPSTHQSVVYLSYS